MSVPTWLYHRREGKYGDRIRRWGSRRPLRMVFTVMDGDDWPATYMLGLGKLGIQYGIGQGLAAGHDGMPCGSRARRFYLGNGLAIGLSWDGPW